MENKSDDDANGSTERTPVIKDFRANVFPAREICFATVSAEGKKNARVILWDRNNVR